ISRKRATRPLIKYSLCPERYNRRLTTTSPGFTTKTGFSAAFLRRFPLTNSDPASAPSGQAAFSCRGAAGCAPPWRDASPWISPLPSAPEPPTPASLSIFSAPSVAACAGRLSNPALSVLGPEFSSALSSTNRAASANSGSSIVMVTSANPIGGRFVVPLKMQSAMRSARSDLWLCSPSTHEIASTTLDLPHPFGPTIQVVPVPLNVTTVRSQNDLKPTISTFRNLSKLSPLVSRCAWLQHHKPLKCSSRVLARPACSGQAAGSRGELRTEKRIFLSSGEGITVVENPTVARSPDKTCGRFSIRAQPPGA